MSPSASGAASARPLLMRAPLLLLLFAAPCAAVTLWIRGRIPLAEHYYLEDKARWFLQHKDEYDLIFVGSSATFRNYVPRRIDEGLRAEGLDVRSFNFGVLGFRAFETDYLIRWILDQEPARLKWLVIEPPPWDLHSKEVQIHTPRATAFMLNSIRLDRTLGPREKAADLWKHLKLGVMNSLNVGRGPDMLAAWREGDREWTPPQWLSEQAGFEAVDERPTFVRPEPNPLGTFAEYRELAKEVERANRSRATLEGYNLPALRSQVAAIREHGVVPIYCFSPILYSMPVAHELHRRGELPNLIAFHFPVTYRELFAYEERVDGAHYYRVGAERFSRFLAPHLAEVLKATAP